MRRWPDGEPPGDAGTQGRPVTQQIVLPGPAELLHAASGAARIGLATADSVPWLV